MAHVIDLRSAVTLLGRFPALAGADLTVDRGEIVVLAGPNGAGKTTVLKVCAGLLAVTDGHAYVLGCDLRADRRAVRGRVGLLGHANALYDDLSAAENVAFWARAAGASHDEVDAALARLRLAGPLAAVPVAKLSAGQRRRAALAALAARRPELWLLDEPHAGLDAEGRDVLDELVRAATAAGATVVVASHELERVASLADRVVAMAGGRTLSPAAARSDASAATGAGDAVRAAAPVAVPAGAAPVAGVIGVPC